MVVAEQETRYRRIHHNPVTDFIEDVGSLLENMAMAEDPAFGDALQDVSKERARDLTSKLQNIIDQRTVDPRLQDWARETYIYYLEEREQLEVGRTWQGDRAADTAISKLIGNEEVQAAIWYMHNVLHHDESQRQPADKPFLQDVLPPTEKIKDPNNKKPKKPAAGKGYQQLNEARRLRGEATIQRVLTALLAQTGDHADIQAAADAAGIRPARALEIYHILESEQTGLRPLRPPGSNKRRSPHKANPDAQRERNRGLDRGTVVRF